MATAQREGGLYYTEKGVAVDADGKPVKDAPKIGPDSDPSKQPGAQGATSPVEQMGSAIAQALLSASAVTGAAPKAQAAGDDSDDEDEVELPVLTKLPRALKKLKSADEVRAMQAKDERAGAVEHYEARLAELEGEK